MSVGYAAGSVAASAVAGAAAEASGGGSHDLLTAVVIGAFGFAGVTLGPALSDRLTRRRKVNHRAETKDEQTQLTDLLRTQLEHSTRVNDDQAKEIRGQAKEIRELRIALDRTRRQP